MKWIILFLLIASTLILCIQDIKNRSINIYLLIFCCILSVCSGLYSSFPMEWLKNSGVNLAFIVLLLSGLTLYFTLSRKKFVNIVDSYLGLGDILFYTTIAFCLGSVNFFFYFNGSLILALISTLIMKPRSMSFATIKIPLVSYAVVFFIPFYVYVWYKQFIYNDEWILQMIY